MKKILSILVCVLLICGLFAACNNASPLVTEAADSELASISFESLVSDTKALSATVNASKTIEECYWFYTAVKTDGGPATGKTGNNHEESSKKPVIASATSGVSGGKGIKNVVISGFSAGEWTFKLYAYDNAAGLIEDENKKIYGPPYDYAGAPATIKASMITTVAVAVEPASADPTKLTGYLKITNITAPDGTNGVTVNHPTLAYTIGSSTVWTKLTKSNDYKWSSNYTQTETGTHLVTIGAFYHTVTGDTFTDENPERKESIAVKIYGIDAPTGSETPSLYTEIAGSIDDLTGGVIFDPTTGAFTVLYDANGATSGTVPVDNNAYEPNGEVVVKDADDLRKTGCKFYGWNTEADGSGIIYSAGDKFRITENTKLYAQWSYTITYDKNGGTGESPSDQSGLLLGQSVKLATSAGMTKTDCNFVGWNTKSDGSGSSYDEGSNVISGFAGNTTLYAIWLSTSVKRVGGRVFYVDPNATGETYTFYTKRGSLITNQSVDGLADAYYYSMDGTPSEKKFYVYENTLGPNSDGLAKDFEWGACDNYVGIVSDGIGYGRTNSDTALNNSNCFVGAQENRPTIWTWLKDGINAKKIGGCDDWFIPSKAELKKLMLYFGWTNTDETGDSGWTKKAGKDGGFFDKNSIWCAVEEGKYDAMYWEGTSSYNSTSKYQWGCVVAVRSF